MYKKLISNNTLYLLLIFVILHIVVGEDTIVVNIDNDNNKDNVTPMLEKAHDTTQTFSKEHKYDHLKEDLQKNSMRRYYKVDRLQSNQTLVIAELEKRGLIESKRSNNFNFKWGWSWETMYVVNDYQIVNHFPTYDEIGTKSGLTRNLNRLRKEQPDLHIESFFPRSYVLSNPNEKNSFIIDFNRQSQQPHDTNPINHHQLNDIDTLEQFGITTNVDTLVYPEQPSIDGNENIWIVKPSTMARGVGIKIFKDLKSLLNYSETFNNEFIVQKYLEKPLLIMKKKFDIRQFVLVKSLNPLVIFLNKDNYLRFCSVEYSTANIDDKFAHLSNHQVQKEFTEELTIPFNQWSLSQFKSYLKENNQGKDIWNDIIYSRIKDLVIKTIKSWPQEGHRKNSFELLGFDIMLTEDLQPILIEVNTNPGLHLITDIVKVHHPNAIRDLFKVVLDNQDRWNNNKNNDNSYQWINDQSKQQKTQLFGAWDPIYIGEYDPNIKQLEIKPKKKRFSIEPALNK
ncbi:hypothetical protein PPL_10710 [Heterostelium album PN500]|uniref:ATP-grasp domain-containing protein n=1 Tax=Heterostelium pallidum (strain ATCC 26659 / Pp 5 / PN500) TaxID=670386 RepID=D3BRU8_HETP5|nr:hypothetical protein PPL_10710 [Heterostelium album PN500]EFA76130.1 hypothetical protein PPL_10710 [Heterostelium album PN500]|eukprot:XP_020428264.1 hypothetical protein PPL_10710 [Heterostelium album PN500]